METPKRAGDAPIALDLKAGKRYSWCSCGLSKEQPLCDGSHKGTNFTPILYKCPEDETKWFCTCKATNGQPFCDGTHNK
ncbi:CDGSH iron-sulfur domain-containing protein [Sungkyunkwania multivorans]|uniref:CDGSH iron-sulfur domain-containing protein n=1 Tax=Sungkyunkwania multivorans TaxID=1173618 RepID=A0ABW3CT06_9FLAO